MISDGDRSGYLVVPEGVDWAPGVLVLHSWWGLSRYFRSVADRLADEGFVALAPDLHLGRTADTPDAAEALLADMDPNVVADLVVSSASVLAGLPVTLDRPIGVLGFSMGASWGLWLAARAPQLVQAVVACYGIQTVDFAAAEAAFQLHAAEHDELVDDDDLAMLEASLHLDGHEVEVHRYPGTGHWFLEEDRPAAHAPEAAALAWSRSVGFLHRHLDP